jgi:riboflavin biosynthesis pyrimidine reductase
VGAGTARTEGYKAPLPKPAHAAGRADRGQRPAPTLALVSRSLDLDPGSELFRQGAERVLVVTSAASDETARRRLQPVADVIVAGEELVDIGSALAEFAARGLTRVLCEGGPSLLAAVAAADRLDELCLTIAPLLVGGPAPRILYGMALSPEADLAIGHLLEEDGALFGRYLRP